MPAPQPRPRKAARAFGWIITAMAGLCAVLVGGLFAARFLWIEPFRIHAASMVPELSVGEVILVDKRFGEVTRGDVMAFRYPPDPSLAYVKRVIGLPGEQVELRDNVVYIEGQPLGTTPLGEVTWSDEVCAWERAVLHREGGGGRAWEVLWSPGERSHLADFGPLDIPAGHYFVLGDNRDNSADSRVWGLVPAVNLVGVMSRSLFVPVRCAG